MNVFIIGSGGCEYVLVWKVVQDLCVVKVFVVLGNVGIVIEVKCENVVIDVLVLE